MVFQMVTQSSCFHSVSRGGGIKEGEDRRQTNCVGQSREKGRELTVDRSLNFFVSEMEKTTQAATEQMTSGRDLSEQIKEVTKENHVRAENTEMMLNFQRGQVTLTQYKLLLCSLYEIYRALEEELDKNSDHPGVAPIYFPSELARLESIEKDLEHFYGQEWRERIVVPAATERYCHRLRQIGKENPELLVAHTYTRYLGDLSGGQVLGRITQKSFGLKNSVGLSFFAFPNVSSPNLFKQLYRSRMNSLELTEEEKTGVLKEAVTAFEFNIQVFQDLQKMLSVTGEKLQNEATPSKFMKTLQFSQTAISTSPVLRMLLGLFVALATVTLFVKF
ncbi:heme oxygenase-like isoform X2 [Thalassophryne amazonica]|uniref:heme oxygenase-like isoform X2 n=1 Tax=Thalassophryne amazonica TaxID=390379 RepID=UPI0014714BDB|nr:heme oxygenase-like isoform X2 [Thalassophryne amazonica]